MQKGHLHSCYRSCDFGLTCSRLIHLVGCGSLYPVTQICIYIYIYISIYIVYIIGITQLNPSANIYCTTSPKQTATVPKFVALCVVHLQQACPRFRDDNSSTGQARVFLTLFSVSSGCDKTFFWAWRRASRAFFRQIWTDVVR